jgi:hypothetical protein
MEPCVRGIGVATFPIPTIVRSQEEFAMPSWIFLLKAMTYLLERGGARVPAAVGSDADA